MTTPSNLLDQELLRDGARPFITWYGPNGERVELSVTTTANWVAKTAGYLIDELAIEPGEALGIDPALHWLTAVTLAGWAIGADVHAGSGAGAGMVDVPLDPMGVAFSRMVAAYPDRFAPVEPSGAEAVSAAPAVPAAARVLTVLPLAGDGLGYGLLGPLAVSGSAVYAAAAGDLPSIAATERVTHTAGVDLPGVPRLD